MHWSSDQSFLAHQMLKCDCSLSVKAPQSVKQTAYHIRWVSSSGSIKRGSSAPPFFFFWSHVNCHFCSTLLMVDLLAVTMCVILFFLDSVLLSPLLDPEVLHNNCQSTMVSYMLEKYTVIHTLWCLFAVVCTQHLTLLPLSSVKIYLRKSMRTAAKKISPTQLRWVSALVSNPYCEPLSSILLLAWPLWFSSSLFHTVYLVVVRHPSNVDRSIKYDRCHTFFIWSTTCNTMQFFYLKMMVSKLFFTNHWIVA